MTYPGYGGHPATQYGYGPMENAAQAAAATFGADAVSHALWAAEQQGLPAREIQEQMGAMAQQAHYVRTLGAQQVQGSGRPVQVTAGSVMHLGSDLAWQAAYRSRQTANRAALHSGTRPVRQATVSRAPVLALEDPRRRPEYVRAAQLYERRPAPRPARRRRRIRPWRALGRLIVIGLVLYGLDWVYTSGVLDFLNIWWVIAICCGMVILIRNA